MIIEANFHGIDLERTCTACPQQYDAYYEGKLVGYLRMRHGRFTVEVPDVGGKLVYMAHPKGDGIFDEDEEEGYLTAACEAIKKELEILT